MMIHHQQIRRIQPGPRFHHKTMFVIVALLAEAVAVLYTNRAPNLGRRLRLQLLTASLDGSVGPGANPRQLHFL